jgi:Domain of unknown function (DU1801)
MGEMKTKPTKLSAKQFIAKVADPARRADADSLMRIFERATGDAPVMWGSSIVGFGQYHYKYASGREGDMCVAGFSPRSAAFALYVLSGAKGEAALLARLGKHTTGKGCLYVKRLRDVDEQVLETLVRTSAAHTRETSRCDTCVTDRAKAKRQRTT